MYSPLALVTIILLHTAMPANATDFAWKSGLTSFAAHQNSVGDAPVESALKTCIEKDLNGSIKAKGAPCILDVTTYLFSAGAALFGPEWGVAEVPNLLPAQETMASGHRPKRDLTYDKGYLEKFNKRLSGHLPNESISAEAIVPSDVHPDDGLAIQMNLHSDNSTLHMHTNGTHMMAKFHDDDKQEPARRRDLTADGTKFQFTGISGIKLEWRHVNYDPNSFKDFPDILNHWIGTATKLLPPPILVPDMWKFQACNMARTATFFYGVIRFKNEKPSLKYEFISPHGC